MQQRSTVVLLWIVPKKSLKLSFILTLQILLILRDTRADEVIDYVRSLFPSLLEFQVDGIPSQEKVDNINRDIGFVNQHNKLKNISKDIFQNMETVKSISLDNNQLESVPENTFWGLYNVTKIDLTKNKIKKVNNKILRDCKNIKYFYFGSNSLTEFPSDILQGLKYLKVLMLNNNQLNNLPVGVFEDAIDLRSIELSFNNLTFIPSNLFRLNSKLHFIRLTGNKIKYISESAFYGISKDAVIYLDFNEIISFGHPLSLIFSPLRKLYLNHNCLQLENQFFHSETEEQIIGELNLTSCCLTEVPTLAKNVKHVLDLRSNNIKKISNTELSFCSHLNLLDLRFNKIEMFSLSRDYPIIQEKNLINPQTKVLIDGNRIQCNCTNLRFFEFLLLKSQKNIIANWTNMEFEYEKLACVSDLKSTVESFKFNCPETLINCPNHCQCILNPDTLIVDCKNRSLKKFPDNLPIFGKVLHLLFQNNNLSLFPHWDSDTWRRIEMIFLDNNNFSSLEGFTLSPQLKTITLRGNKLNKLDNELKDLLLSQQNLSVTLSNNPWICNCDAVFLKDLMSRSLNRIIDFRFLLCKMDNESYRNISTISNEYCQKLSEYIVIPITVYIVIPGTILIFLTAFLMYRFKSEIRLWFFTRGWCLSFISEKDIDKNKLFDAFISYCTADELWVANVLVPNLEQGNPSYQLCLHTRDWLVGEWIPDQIIRSVQSSRRTIIVFSKEFVRSCWSRMEFHVAHQQSVTDKINRLIIIVLGELPDINDLDAEMKMYVKLNTYIKSEDDDFWRKLRCIMPRTRTNNAAVTTV